MSISVFNPASAAPVERLHRILDLAVVVLDDKEKAYGWLVTPNPVLENQRPVDLVHSEEGAYRVEQVLNRIAHGIYS